MTNSNLCMFCYKTACVGDEIQNFKGKNSVLYAVENEVACDLQIFLKLLERFVLDNEQHGNEKLSFLSSVCDEAKLRLGCCINCATMVNAFCEAYHHMKVLELKLEWNLKKLMDIMRCADRVPSRQQQLKRAFQNVGLSDWSTTKTESEMTRLMNFKDARHCLIKECSRRLSHAQPRVTVNRMKTKIAFETNSFSVASVGNFENVDTSSSSPASDLILPQDVASEVFFGWITSYAAVALLASMSTYPRTRTSNKTVNVAKNRMRINKPSIDGNSSSSASGKLAKRPDAVIISLSDSNESNDERPIDDGAGMSVFGSETASNFRKRISRKKRIVNSTQKTDTMESQMKNIAMSSIQKSILMKKVKIERYQDIGFGETQISDELSSCENYVTNSSNYGENSTLKEESSAKSKKRKVNLTKCSNAGMKRGITMAECDNCKKKMRKRNLKRHIKRWHDIKIKSPNQVRKCNIQNCSAFFKKNWQLHQHKRQIHNIIPITSQADEQEEMDNVCKEAEKKGNTGRFECKICNKTFSSLGFLQTHKRRYHRRDAEKRESPVRTIQNKFICPVYHCTQSFSTFEKLQSHRKLHGSFKCNFCDVVKEYAIDLAIHETEHAIRAESISFNGDIAGSGGSAKGFNCSRCFRDFHRNKSLYLKHFLQTHLDLYNNTTCPICSVHFPAEKLGGLRKHLQAFHNTQGLKFSQIHKCDECIAFFVKSSQLFNHKYHMHFKGKCPECGKAVDGIQNFKDHFHQKHPFSNCFPAAHIYKCGLGDCKKIFNSREELTRHKEQQHVKCENKFTCSKCGKIFEEKDSFNVHIKSVHVSRSHICLQPYVCQFCGEKFVHRRIWRNHVAKHGNEKE